MKLNLIIAYASLLLFSSCFRPYYIAPLHNVPLFKEKNEFRASASVGMSETIASENIQLAYSATNHFALIGSYMGVSAREINSENSGKGNYLDLGGGYFKTFDKHGVLELLGGFGRCNQAHTYEELVVFPVGRTPMKASANLSFNKIFVQPSIGFTSKAFDIAFTGMLSNIYFTNVSHNLDSVFLFDSKMLSEYQSNPSIVMFEPTITLRGGWKFVKAQIQLTKSYSLSGPLLDPLFEQPIRISIGLYFSFAQRFNDKKAEPKEAHSPKR